MTEEAAVRLVAVRTRAVAVALDGPVSPRLEVRFAVKGGTLARSAKT